MGPPLSAENFLPLIHRTVTEVWLIEPNLGILNGNAPASSFHKRTIESSVWAKDGSLGDPHILLLVIHVIPQVVFDPSHTGPGIRKCKASWIVWGVREHCERAHRWAQTSLERWAGHENISGSHKERMSPLIMPQNLHLSKERSDVGLTQLVLNDPHGILRITHELGSGPALKPWEVDWLCIVPVCFLNEKLLLVIEFRVTEMLQDKHSILHPTWQYLTWKICPTCFVLKSQTSQQPMEFMKTDCDLVKVK